MTAAVHAGGLVKKFDHVRAVDGVDLDVGEGEISVSTSADSRTGCGS